MVSYEKIKAELNQYNDQKKAGYLPNFFQSFPGGYGEGDLFLGITVPNQRKTAKKFFKQIELNETEKLLNELYHEYRLTALFLLVYKYEKSILEQEKKEIVDLYLRNVEKINNWDLVDSSAEKILGAYLFEKDKKILYEFAQTNHLWRQRIAIISTFYFIRNNSYSHTLEIAGILFNHKHDLIHKAVGWMLREVGNRDFSEEFDFLKKNYQKMPRTMLRYAIEKFEPDLRQKFLKGLI